MKKMTISDFEPDYSYRQCVSAIKSEEERRKMLAQVDNIKIAAIDFLEHSKAGTTSSIPPVRIAKGDNPSVVGDITKAEMVRLYEYYMVKREPGRSIYNAILISAEESCPLCGGIGHAKTLDHYLPKANYPLLTVLPYNLVPACRDCNTEKGNPIITDAAEQLIHPYYDQACFYDDTWVVAEVTHESPCAIKFSACPPEQWLPLNKSRANRHFEFFSIARRYGIRAGEELGTLVDQRRGFLKTFSPEQFSLYLKSVAESPTLFPNHWRKVMYLALAEDEWFCSADL
ncbi:HNH endonuclease [Pseudomonas sp. PS01300]|uniref:HNH endonuclease n=1 Tax=Pseudomonas sp. PS01300 TaxID=2991436 RepID=UPI00249B3411|nr:HNH endonuclease [Pseudomonas sp. PS01300]